MDDLQLSEFSDELDVSQHLPLGQLLRVLLVAGDGRHRKLLVLLKQLRSEKEQNFIKRGPMGNFATCLRIFRFNQLFSYNWFTTGTGVQKKRKLKSIHHLPGKIKGSNSAPK